MHPESFTLVSSGNVPACYEAITDSICVQARPIYLEDESEPDSHRYIWAYQIRIENHGDESVKLLNRYWQVIDAHGRIQEVRGAGVVGEQPELQPGETFEYMSGTALSTASGFMRGEYEMESGSGKRFDVDIPTFALDIPGRPATVH